MKNDTIYGLFNDNNFMFNSLIDLINEESKRIVSLSLASKQDLDVIVVPCIKQAVNSVSVHDQVKGLSQIHAALKEIKLPNDFKKLAGFVEIEITTNNMGYSLRPVNALDASEEQKTKDCCDNCSEGKECCDVVDKDEPETTKSEANEEIFNKLEKIAYNSGLRGNQEVAYAIEKFIAYNK